MKEKKNKSVFDPTVKAGDTVEIHGIPVYVASQEEIDKAVEEEGMFVACIRCEHNGKPVPSIAGSKRAICGECRCDVWISQATSQSCGLARIRCMECVMNMMKDEMPP